MAIEALEQLSVGPGFIDFDPPRLTIPAAAWPRSSFPIYWKTRNGGGKSTFALALAGAIPNALWASLDLKFVCELQNSPSRATNQAPLVVPQMWEHFFLGYDAENELSLTVEPSAWARHVRDVLEVDRLREADSSRLSYGEKKRLMLAIGLAAGAPLLVTDEWYQHLDARWQHAVTLLYEEYEQEGGAHLGLVSRYPQVGGEATHFAFDFLPPSAGPQGGLGTLLLSLVERALHLSDLGNVRSVLDAGVSLRHVSEAVVHIAAAEGDLLEVVGPNGCGKSTLLRNFWRRTLKRGRRSAGTLPMKLVLTEPRFQLQGPRIEDELLRSLPAGASLCGDEERKRPLQELQRDVLTLSYAERKLVAVAAALLSDFPVLAIDEPMEALDEENGRAMEGLLRLASESGRITLVAHPHRQFDWSRTLDLSAPLGS